MIVLRYFVSKFKGCGELELVTLYALFVSELRNKPCVQIEQALSNLRRVGNDWPNTEGTATEPMESVRGWSAIVAELLDPATRSHLFLRRT